MFKVFFSIRTLINNTVRKNFKVSRCSKNQLWYSGGSSWACNTRSHIVNIICYNWFIIILAPVQGLQSKTSVLASKKPLLRYLSLLFCLSTIPIEYLLIGGMGWLEISFYYFFNCVHLKTSCNLKIWQGCLCNPCKSSWWLFGVIYIG